MPQNIHTRTESKYQTRYSPELTEQEVKQFKLFSYPEIYDNYKQQVILGGKGVPGYVEGEKEFRWLNGVLGPRKQLKFWVMIFHDAPSLTGEKQEAYLKGGNKNEFIITIGVDSNNKVQWCHPFSWSDSEEMKIKIRDEVTRQEQLNLSWLANYVGPLADKEFVRKQFILFKYLSINLPWWQMVLSWLITLLVNVVLSAWIVKNDFHDRKSTYRYHY